MKREWFFVVRAVDWITQWNELAVALSPLHLVPVFGIMISAYLKASGKARYLHHSVRTDDLSIQSR